MIYADISASLRILHIILLINVDLSTLTIQNLCTMMSEWLTIIHHAFTKWSLNAKYVDLRSFNTSMNALEKLDQ